MSTVLVYVVLLELGIVAGSGVDAWARGGDYTWFGRWLWWHLAPLWALVLIAVAALAAASRTCAMGAVLRFERAQARMTLVAPASD